ncbi:SH3 domain-containing protein [Massilia sp. YIM B02763]|uniref:SH3 domain-containing protein n=1 Tax=Massilia sp. YIM B02763 TaxID=3050130 RepID=UPI0025B685C7|nr:SH3 domain-containing protein [Massilia sp. YIM B02763]MDN4056098.1 SH3 domain-containing protein [Massilia sp. YIM B02763]
MNAWLPALLAYGAALVLTLALAARLTPRGWWRRANLRAFAVVAGGTLALGTLFGALAGLGASAPPLALAEPLPAPAPVTLVPEAPPPTRPDAGVRYRVVDDLNLRSDNGVGAPRLRVLAAGTVVRATGKVDGDWWQVRARVDGAPVEGWASSLWLRRADEGHGR